MQKKCPYSKLFWSAFSWIRTESGIQSEYVKMRTRITPNKDTFHAVYQTDSMIKIFEKYQWGSSILVKLQAYSHKIEHFQWHILIGLVLCRTAIL